MFWEAPERRIESIPYSGRLGNPGEIGGVSTGSYCTKIKCTPNASSLFSAMATGGVAGFEQIDHFNGGLFESDSVLPLEQEELKLLDQTTDLDWSNIEPSIFGTLFERGLDPDKRSQQGAHYTDTATIMKIVRPVVLEPWEAAWEDEKPILLKLLEGAEKKVSKKAVDRLNAFLDRLHRFRVLDPACGSGNFLYLALRTLKNFEKRVIQEAEALGFPPQFPSIGPEAVRGVEINPYAAEVAGIAVKRCGSCISGETRGVAQPARRANKLRFQIQLGALNGATRRRAGCRLRFQLLHVDTCVRSLAGGHPSAVFTCGRAA